MKFRACLIDKNKDTKETSFSFVSLSEKSLPNETVLVDIDYSSLNYKDALAITGEAPICRSFPMVPGIDFSGTVIFSKDERFIEGQKVLSCGCGLSEDFWGGYSELQKVNPDFLIHLPDNFNSEEVMAIGTAGLTAMLSVSELINHGIKPDDGPILVTGASGGVGSLSIILLSKLGYSIFSSTGDIEKNFDYLKKLGATEIVDRNIFNEKSKPLEKQIWAGAIDSIGGQTLGNILSKIKYGGLVTACGLVGGMNINSTIAPFILRGVTLKGIDSVNCDFNLRNNAWRDLANLIDKDKLKDIYSVKPLSDIRDLSYNLLKGDTSGRIVIDVNH